MAMEGNGSGLRLLRRDRPLTSRDLLSANFRGDTALHEAARFGQLGVAEIILETGGVSDLVVARNKLGETPLYVAAACGKTHLFNFLKKRIDTTKEDVVLRRNDGQTVLHAAVIGDYYSLALEIMDSFPHLWEAHDENGTTALNLLATKPRSFRSGSSYSFNNLGSETFIPLQFLRCLVYLCIPSMVNGSKAAGDVEDQGQDGVVFSRRSYLATKLFSGYRRIIRELFWLRVFFDVKQKHGLALEVAKRLIGKQEDWSSEVPREELLQNQYFLMMKSNRSRNPLFQAAENSIQEFVEEVVGKCPKAVHATDRNGKNLLHIAVEQKDRILYDYLKDKVYTDGALAAVDREGNTVLHLAAKLGNSPRNFLGHLNRMSWDVCWHKRVWYDSPPYFLYHRNSEGKTASEIFEESHSALRENAEKALKDMNNGLMLVSALIGTVNYAALFTIPGGFNQTPGSQGYGEPILTHTNVSSDLILFLWYIGVALFSSLCAPVTMLLIQLCRFCSQDFFMSLPIRFFVAITALCCSSMFTTLSCFKAYNIIDRNFGGNSFIWPAFFVQIVIYVDTVYLTSNYLYFSLRCSFYYSGQEM